MKACPLCDSTSSALFCASCVASRLYTPRQDLAYKKVAARDVMEQARAVLEAHSTMIQKEQELAMLLQGIDEKQQRILQTAKRVSSERLLVAQKRFMLDDRARALRRAKQALETMTDGHRQRSVPLLTGLREYMDNAKGVLNHRVWIRVMELFVILPIEADLPPHRTATPAQQAQPLSSRPHVQGPRGPITTPGVSTIAGLPLPNSGIYTGVPDEVLEAALYLVAKLTDMLATTLRVALPHPLCFPACQSYAVIADDTDRNALFALSPSKREARGDDGGDRQRLASAVRTPDGEEADPLQMGMEYLQYNVHRMAIEAGVDSSELWGKEAVLLNLWAIHQHGMRLLTETHASPDLPLPAIRKRVVSTTPAVGFFEGHSGAPVVVFEEKAEDWAFVKLESPI